MARPGELPALVGAFGQHWYFARQLHRQVEGRGELLIAWSDGQPVGDVVLVRDPVPEAEIRAELPGVPMISHLEVDPAHQRRGIGSQLLATAEELARGYGHELVVLGCGTTNPARTMYDARGYDDWGHGTVTFRWSEPEPDSELCHVLIKLLDPTLPPLTDWARAWVPAEAADRLRAAPVAWAIAAGWAVDLHLDGRAGPARAHSDLEIAIPRHQFSQLRPYLGGLDCYQVGSGRVRPLGPDQEPGPDEHQIWLHDRAARAWRMDTFLEPGTAETWVSPRDPRVTRPMSRAVRRTGSGIPYLAPELVLFMKAKRRRPKDEADLDRLLSTSDALDGEQRAWLADALRLAHPGHPWEAAIVH